MNLREGFKRLGAAAGAVAASSIFIFATLEEEWEFWDKLILAASACFIVYFIVFTVVGWILSTTKDIKVFRNLAFLAGVGFSITTVLYLFWWFEDSENTESASHFMLLLVAILPVTAIAAFGLPFAVLRLSVWIIAGFGDTENECETSTAESSSNSSGVDQGND